MRILHLVCLTTFSFLPARAVIVASGFDNTTKAALENYLASDSLPAFPYWDNLVRVTNSSGVYLGYDPVSGNGWVISSAHISPKASTIDIAGASYLVASQHSLANTDLYFYELKGHPDLPSIPMTSTAPLDGEFGLMFGRGYTTNVVEPYSQGSPGTNPAHGMRWGTNTLEESGSYDVGNGTMRDLMITQFDAPGDPNATAYDAQGANGDSGGGLFLLRSGVWELSGIAFAVDSGQAGVPANPAYHGYYTAFTDLYAARNAEGMVSGLVPEPGTLWMLVLGSGLLLQRRRA